MEEIEQDQEIRKREEERELKRLKKQERIQKKRQEMVAEITRRKSLVQNAEEQSKIANNVILEYAPEQEIDESKVTQIVIDEAQQKELDAQFREAQV